MTDILTILDVSEVTPMKVTVKGEVKDYPVGTTYEEIADEYQKDYGNTIAVVKANGKIRELFKKVSKDCELDFFTTKDDIGHKTYVRTAIMMFMKAVQDTQGGKIAFTLEYTIGAGYYLRPKNDAKATEAQIKKIKQRMQELVVEEQRIFKRSYPIGEAVDLFKRQGMDDKVKLFRYRRSSSVNVYEMDGYYDYYYGYMFPNCKYVKYFELIPYDRGVMLILPDKSAPTEVKPLDDRPRLFRALEDADAWCSKLGIETVGDLNDHICNGRIADMILVQEAEQERRIGEIAKDIASRKGVKFVMIAGPSSSGKTTFSHRLSIQLATQGLTPHPIGLDDYFKNREDTPKDENGNYNFECLGAIDVEQFNEDMVNLLAGKTVELPTFNFKTGKREYKGNYKTLGPEDVLVIEGIHGLNDKMSYKLPAENKYKIYISALTCINVDDHNRIPTTDGRLLRRMVRDARTRGTSAKGTIAMWPSVRRGEEENIFPFQEGADAIFNSVLIYELAVLKQYAEPLLFGIEPGEPEYYEAKRLLKFLDYFIGVSSENLPNNSICREFVGGSCFNV